MQLIKSKTVKFFLILIILGSSIIVIQSQVLTDNQQIIVDVDRVIADFSTNPIGINLNFLLDTDKVIQPTQKLNLGSLRYPMGEIADYYLFDRNHPDKPQVAIKDSHLWFAQFTNIDGTWKNPLDFDRFIKICRAVNAEPFVVVGIDALAYSGDAPHATFDEVLQAAVDWVEYANIIKGYDVKYWEIGNENDLNSDFINWNAEKYAETVVKLSHAMKQVDPSIKVGVNGMTGIEWWDKVMPIAKDDVDFLVTHQYSSMQNYQQWHSNNWNYTYNLEVANQAIKKYNSKLRLNVTEFSSFNPSKSHANNIWKMLHNFEIIGNILSFSQVDYCHFWISQWFAENLYLADYSAFDREYNLMLMSYPLKIWSSFLRQQIVFSSKQIENIRSWASFDPDNGALNIFLLNKNTKPQFVEVKLKNYSNNTKNADRVIINGNSPISGKADWKEASPIRLKRSRIKTKLKPLSITVISSSGNK